ncbi:hypothetical protein HK101_004978 [Irineochytrium annulatum]|nr:hypothetical protein HK101_004978 [Irineochytrium annulatum]
MRNPHSFLFDLVRVHDPPLGNGDETIMTTGGDWRAMIYLQSIRRLKCERYDGFDRVLPWLRKLDWVDATFADEAWMHVLAEWLCLPSQCPRHLCLDTSPHRGGTVLLGVLGYRVRSLQLKADSKTPNGLLATFLNVLTTSKESSSIEAFAFDTKLPGDIELIAECLIALGRKLRCLKINYSGTKSHQIKLPVLSSVCRLERLQVAGMPELALRLISASRETLIQLSLPDFYDMPVMKTAIDELQQLQSLHLDFQIPMNAYIQRLQLEAVPSIVRLTIRAGYRSELEGCVAIMEKVSVMTGLREFSLDLGDYSCDLNDETVVVPIRLTNLRLFHLKTLELKSSHSISLLNWEEIELNGLPTLEDIHFDVRFLETNQFCEENVRTLVERLDALLLDNKKTPALAYASVCFWETTNLAAISLPDAPTSDNSDDGSYEFFWRAVQTPDSSPEGVRKR